MKYRYAIMEANTTIFKDENNYVGWINLAVKILF